MTRGPGNIKGSDPWGLTPCLGCRIEPGSRPWGLTPATGQARA